MGARGADWEPAPGASLPGGLSLGEVHLTVRDLDRAIAWYERVLGLRVHGRANHRVELGDGVESSVVLREDPDAGPAGRHAGLYHYALLFGSREELARAAARVFAADVPLQGFSDHGTHEAIYLPDADGNGIELAADRPRDQWRSFEEEFSQGGPAPLDLQSLMSTIAGESPRSQVGEGLRVGHLHLHVGDIDEALGFYRDVLGFELQANVGSAAFVSAGGYHHHLGVNIWKGQGVGPPPPHTVGLRHWTVRLPIDGDVAAVRARAEAAGALVEAAERGFRTVDPWRLAVDFVPARAGSA